MTFDERKTEIEKLCEEIQEQFEEENREFWETDDLDF
jgi:hypothetical protein